MVHSFCVLFIVNNINTISNKMTEFLELNNTSQPWIWNFSTDNEGFIKLYGDNGISKEDLQKILDSIVLDGEDYDYTLQVNGNVQGEIHIPQSQFLKSVNYDKNTHILTFVFITTDGERKEEINLGDLIDDYTSGNGIDLSEDNIISLKLNEESETFVTLDENGLKIDGIQKAIDDAVLVETERAEAKEEELKGLIEAEAERAEAKEDELEKVIADEVERAEAKDDELEKAIADEVERAEAKEEELKGLIEAETERAEAKEDELEKALQEGLDTKADADSVYTKVEADDKFLTEHQDISELATKEELSKLDETLTEYVDKQVYEHTDGVLSKEEAKALYQPIGDYSTNQQLEELSKTVENNKSEIEGIVEDLSELMSDKIENLENELDTKADSTSVYTQDAVNNLLDKKADTKDVYTKTEVDKIVETAVLPKADKTDLETLSATVVANKTEVDNTILSISDTLEKKANFDDVYTKSQLYTQSEVNSLLADKADDTDLNDYVTNSAFEAALAGKTNVGTCYTITDADSIFATKSQLLSEYEKKEVIEGKYYTKANVDSLLVSYTTTDDFDKLQNVVNGKASANDVIELSQKLNTKADTNTTYTKNEVDTLLNNKIDNTINYVDGISQVNLNTKQVVYTTNKGEQTASVIVSDATSTASGLMSALDKVKLDTIPEDLKDYLKNLEDRIRALENK